MSLLNLALASLRHFWRTNLALMLGIAIGTAVLTGAFIVGDSIRGSLKSLTLERLGKINEILIGEQFFREELASEVSQHLGESYSQAVPAILVNQATIEITDRAEALAETAITSRAQGVTVVGLTKDFWSLSASGSSPQVPGPDEIVINQALADELDANVGDTLLLRVGKPAKVAADSPLSRKSDLVKTIVDLKLTQIIPATGLGRFSMQASQSVPANAFVSLEVLQDGLDQEGKINAVLVGAESEQPATEESFDALTKAVTPNMEDMGLKLKRVALTYQEKSDNEPTTVAEYDALTNERMLFTPEHEAAVREQVNAWNGQPCYTYLATKMQKLNESGEPDGHIVPYSTISGIDSRSELGPLLVDGEPIEISDQQIVLNDWTAEAMGASVGDRIRVTYFEPETTHGDPVEQSEDFLLVSIVPLVDPADPFTRRRAARYVKPPTLVNDPNLTPAVKGITDAESIDKWDAPFPMERNLIKGPDDKYWRFHRTTPKAFVSLTEAQRLWQSRFGKTTNYRIPITGGETLASREESLSRALGSKYESFGMRWIRAKKDGLAASKGTTPFDALFFGFSQFIIAAALMLVALLVRLSLEQRSTQLGLVGALGFDQKRSFRLLLAEHAVLVIAGAVLGVLIGIAYASLMLTGLRTWWVEAVVTPFMQLTVTPRSLTLGFVSGVLVSLATIAFTLRRLRKLSPSQLMSGKTEESLLPKRRKRGAWLSVLPWLLIVGALGLAALAPTLPPEPQGGAFFGAGACVLAALLMFVSGWLKKKATAVSSVEDLNIQALAARNLTRNPTRSTLTIGLVAAACFLIIAISAFRLAPTEGGTGGFELVGISDQPIFEELGSQFEADSEKEGLRTFSLRMKDGDDASCRNLYQSSKPQLIGITDRFVKEVDTVGAMDWAGVDADLPEGGSKWNVLAADFLSTSEDLIPVVVDKNTAMYSMQIYTGVGTEFERDYGPGAGKLKFKIVGLLSGSTFQGSLLCLLYTSPSPRDQRGSRMPSSA